MPVGDVGRASEVLARQAGLAVVGRADEVEDEVRGQALFVFQESADGFTVGVRAEAVVMRRGQRQRRALRGRLASFRVVREQRVVERTSSERATFGDERRASARCQWGLLPQVDDAAERVGAVEGGGGATQDFDGGQSEDAVASDLVGVGEALRQASPIEEDGCLSGISTAEEDRADRTFAGLLRGEDTGGATEQARQGRLPGVGRGGHVEAADGGRGFGQGLRLSGFDHHGLGQAGRSLGEEKGGEGQHYVSSYLDMCMLVKVCLCWAGKWGWRMVLIMA